MVRNNVKTQVAFFAAMVFVLGFNCRCIAQATDPTLVDTPSQRWLPPPKSYPTQQENQAKLLTLLRDSILQGDGAKQSSPSRLSDSEVQSLKKAMKQFESYFPEGLTADSLDAIPPELISKALSNPELVKQAKELAEKYSKENEKKKSKGQPSEPNDPNLDMKPTNKAAPTNSQSPQKSQPPFEQNKPNSEERSDKSIRESSPDVDPKGKGFADLMNKLRSTQQTYEQNQEPSNSLSGEPKSSSATERSSRSVVPPPDFEGASPASPNSQSPPSSRPDSTPSNQTTTRNGQQVPSSSQQPGTSSTPSLNNGQSSSPRRNSNPRQSPNSSNSKASEPIPPNPQQSESNPSQRKTDSALPPSSRENSSSNSSLRNNSSLNNLENEIRKQFNDGRLGNSPSNENQRSENPSAFSPRNEGRGDNSNPFSRDSVNSNDPKPGVQSSSSLDVRRELDRRGFGPTMQKIVEEAQRASQAARPKATPSNQSEPTPSTSTKSDNELNQESKSNVATTTPTKQPSSSLSKPNEPSPRTPRADSPVAKNMQKTGDYLNKLWTDATKSSAASPKPAATRSSASRNSSSTPFARPEIPSIPNPFNVQVLQGILVLAVACVVAFLVLKLRFRKEQERKMALASQVAPTIDEIQTRDDVVRAFHALAKQRLKSAQAWWTCGYVAERFQETLPEHAQPIRTLSGLYEQARYYPKDHQLSDAQIQTAKLALKQCEG